MKAVANISDAAAEIIAISLQRQLAVPAAATKACLRDVLRCNPPLEFSELRAAVADDPSGNDVMSHAGAEVTHKNVAIFCAQH